MRYLLIALLFAVTRVQAAPPEGQLDPSVHAWFESLVRADGMHCCGEADCRLAAPGEVRTSGDHYQVLVDGVWVPVPDSLVVSREDNPLAGTIICRTHLAALEGPNRLYCVIPFSGG